MQEPGPWLSDLVQIQMEYNCKVVMSGGRLKVQCPTLIGRADDIVYFSVSQTKEPGPLLSYLVQINFCEQL